MDVQIALQGGGAKLFSLLVAMREVERLEGRIKEPVPTKDGSASLPAQALEPPKIRVTHIAGTSAGAIVAALYAARVPMDDVLRRLAEMTIDELLPHYQSKSKIRRAASRILDLVVRALLWLPSDTKKLLNQLNVNLGNALLGDPIYSTEGLKTQLIRLFNESSQIRFEDNERNKSEETLPKWGSFKDVCFDRFGSDGSVPLSVIRTELRTRKPHTANSYDNLINFLADSAAIPFVFRNVNETNWDLLDGGICANLPSQFLYGVRRIAIGFASPSPTDRESKWTRPLDLLDAAIDYSVDRSVELIGEENCCRLASQLSTFDFFEVVGKGTKRKFDEEQHIVRQTRQFLDRFIARATAESWLGGDQWKFAYRSDCVAQRSALASTALRNALLKIGSLTPSKFPQKKIFQVYVLDLEGDNGSGAFTSEMIDERVLEISDHITTFKMTVAYPQDALITHHSFVGTIGSEDRKLDHSPCLDEESQRADNGDIKRVVLLDLAQIHAVRESYNQRPGCDGTPVDDVCVRRTLSAQGLIRSLFDAATDGEEFGIDLRRVSSERVDVTIEVHLPDRYLNLSRTGKLGEYGRGEIDRLHSSELVGKGVEPKRKEYSCVRYQASGVLTQKTRMVGFKLLLNELSLECDGART
ncbi:patatin-like phospholipase family protein [Bradyrhizobium oligotrophicum]|uniref:patatin-like phospholipase family protein n=1 Tax=Bradyrhizobium oligotrophicum TaxID=44255 RepID=UPI001360B1CF|nr:patatin-like phospholipase family protein [Bradyrhizobium oligotrophicum]